MSEKYQPSNGTEGMWFTETYCMNCLHCDPNPDGEKQCQILFKTMVYSTKDAEYPKEWTYDENDNPICTSHVKWDWDNDGNPDDPNNPKYVIPDDPNQLVLPLIMDEILEGEKICT